MPSSALRVSLGWGALLLIALTASGGAGCGGSDSNGGGTTNPEGGTGDGATTPEGGTGATCGMAGVTTGFVGSQSITVGGVARTYELFVPPGYDAKTPFPLVFVFHGDGGTGADIRSAFDLETESQGAALFVYPDGLGQTWNIDDAAGLQKDVAFVDAMAAQIGSTLCADPKRVFAVGFSKGAYFTNQLACITKTSLRAVVTHSGGGPFFIDGLSEKFDDQGNLVCPSMPVAAALQVQGDADTTVPPSEGQKARDYWLAANACATTTQAYDPSPCVAYDGCATNRPEVWCEVPALDHTLWTNATKVTWAFVKGK